MTPRGRLALTLSALELVVIEDPEDWAAAAAAAIRAACPCRVPPAEFKRTPYGLASWAGTP